MMELELTCLPTCGVYSALSSPNDCIVQEVWKRNSYTRMCCKMSRDSPNHHTVSLETFQYCQSFCDQTHQLRQSLHMVTLTLPSSTCHFLSEKNIGVISKKNTI